ncbi:MAG: hypothetical protein CR961_00580 [Polaribacter sp.]|nr:MAG: hypothetical protein CR961_00580 [Polaribacter sp.]
MNLRTYIAFLFCLLWFSAISFAQKKQRDSIKKPQIQVKYNPLSPARAAFYSTVLPGAGQIYNNRYWWQLPLIYGGLATSTYYYIINDNAYDKYRTAFKRRKAGLSDEFDGKDGRPLISENGLESAQRQTRRNREMSLLCILGVYALQIVEASVTAHLLQFDDSDGLSVQPTTIPNDIDYNEIPTVGLAVKYSF